MKGTIKLILLVSLLSAFKSNGQSFSEFDAMHTKARSFATINNDSLKFYGIQMQLSKDKLRKLYGHYIESTAHYYDKNISISEKILREHLSEIDSINYRNYGPYQYCKNYAGQNLEEAKIILKINFYRRLFYIMRRKGKIEEAYNFLEIRKNLLEQLPRKDAYYHKNLISIKRSFAILNFTTGSYKKAIKLLKELELDIIYAKVENDSMLLKEVLFEKTYIYNSIGNNYLFLEMKNNSNFDSALVYYTKAYLNIKETDSTNIKYLSDFYARASRVEIKRENFQKAIQYADLQGDINTGFDSKLGNTYVKARAFAGIKNWDSAIFYGSYYLETTKEKSYDNEKQIGLLNDLAISYYNKRKLDSAYKYSNLTLVKSDSLKKHVKSTLNKIHSSDIESYIKLNKKIKAESKISKISFWVAVYIFVSLLLLLITYVFNNQRKNKKKYLELLKLFNTTQVAQTINSPFTINKLELDTELKENLLLGFKKIENSGVYLDVNFSLRMASKILKSNTTYVSKFVNENFDLSFKQYIFELRMISFSEKLIKNKKFKNYSIEAMGREVGYKNASSFSRAFKKYYGISPSEYLKNNH